MTPLLCAADVARLDAAAEQSGVAGATLMRAAGQAVATAALAYCGAPGAQALVLAGPGKNGGDGYVAARLLRERGVETKVLEISAQRRAGDAHDARAAWIAAGGALETLGSESLEKALDGAPSVIVDALFGVGLSRPLEGPAAEAVARLARDIGAARVLAVDMPSGISADTGAALGVAISADVTVTFVAKKPGQLLGDGARACGVIEVADIGMPSPALALAQSDVWEIAPGLWRRPLAKPVDAHKYDHGAALVAAGGFGATGAARLAALGALRIGAGLVTVAAPSAAMPECAAQLTAVMLREAEAPEDFAALLADARIRAAALGMGHAAHPGGLDRSRAFALAALASAQDRLTVLDADALTAFADAPADLFAAIAGQPVVLTPHLGEFARLFPDLAERLRQDSGYGKLAAVREAAKRSGATILLKGVDTVVAAPDGRAGLQAATAARAAPWLATAGSGDVLAGVIAGLGARGFPPFDAACAGAWAHLEAGVEAGPGLIAEDLPGALRAVLRRLAPKHAVS